MKPFLSNILLTTLIAGISAGKFDYAAKPRGTAKCALINVAMDESVSTANERAFIKNTALPRIGQTLKTNYKYDEVFLCGGAFAGNNRYGSDQYRHKGCTTINSSGKIRNNAVVTWKRHAGRYEDGYTGMVRSMQDVYDTIEGIDLIAHCGSIDKNLILVTDEDRDDKDSTIVGGATLASVKQMIKDNGYILNVIANIHIANKNINLGMKMEQGGNHNTIFQMDANDPKGYKEIIDTRPYTTIASRDFGKTREDYARLLIDTPGALWNLNSLRAGGNIASTFADVFVEIKVSPSILKCFLLFQGFNILPFFLSFFLHGL